VPKRKPVVLYRVNDYQHIAVGAPAVVWPTNHPSLLVSNNACCITTVVERLDNDGEFETANTIYRPLKETENVLL